MASGGFDIAKAGWLYRQSSVLHRWKRNWFVLDREGDLRYFGSPDHPVAKERLVIRAVVVAIKTGQDCRQTALPEGIVASKACFLELVLQNQESLLLCAEVPDDMKAWQIALEEARTLGARSGVTTTTTNFISPPGYVNYGSPYVGHGYSGHVISNGTILQPPPTQVIQSPYGTTTVVNTSPYQQVVYVNDGLYRSRQYSYDRVYPVPFFFW